MDPKKRFVCPKCSFSFTRKHDLTRHIANINQCQSNQQERFVCSNCSASYSRKRYLLLHISRDRCKTPDSKIRDSKHLQKGIIKLNFESSEEFLLWKDEEEQRSLSKFSKNTRSWVTRDGKRTKYVCHRSGYIRIKDPSIRKRSLKLKGSCKINNHCTAYMLSTELQSGKIEVEYCRKHVNHYVEMKHLPISTSDKNKFANRLKEGVPMNQILDEVREDMFHSPLSRRHLIRKTDLHNINAEYGIAFKERLSNVDGVSVELLIEKYKEKFGDETPFRFHKMQTKDDTSMMIVIMDKIQISTMKKYGNDKICIDSTQATNQCDFLLTTVMVVNDLNMGFPVAYAISDKDNYTYMKTFFEIIKRDCGVIEPNVFMSDDFPAYIDAWKEVMGPPPDILLCTWHVNENWRKNLSKVDNKFQKEVYKLVRTLLEEFDENCFPDIVDNAVQKLKETPETEDYGNYFEKEYSQRYEKWAFAFRKYIGLDTNMSLEALHREIKSVHLDGNQSRSLDSFIATLLKLNLRKEHARITHSILDTDTRTLKKIRDKHKEGKAIPRDDVIIIDGDNAFVRSQSGPMTYSITRAKPECPCKLRCSECDMCLHLYQCGCADNAFSGNFCKHLHIFGIMKAESYDYDCFIDDVFDDIAIQDSEEIEICTVVQHTQSQKDLIGEKEIGTDLKSTAWRILQRLGNLDNDTLETEIDGNKALNLLKQAEKLLHLNGKNEDIRRSDWNDVINAKALAS